MTNLYAPKARQGGECQFNEFARKLEPREEDSFQQINGYQAKTAQAQGTVATFQKLVEELKEGGYAGLVHCSAWTFTGPNQTARRYELTDRTGITPRTVQLDIVFSRKGNRNYDAQVTPQGVPERARTAEVDTRLLRDLERNLLSSSQPN